MCIRDRANAMIEGKQGEETEEKAEGEAQA